MFCEDIADLSRKIGDVVLVLDGWSYLLGIAEVTTKHCMQELARGFA
jgi:hypothetical protein